MTDNPINTDVDFGKDGVQHGHLKLPHSSEQAAWGAVMTPLTVVRNGNGPTALLTGANHGDEYEGPIALLNLAATLQQQNITGRVIIVPMMNHPAFLAGRRTSPLDGGNMNRLFPGDPTGSPTQKLADYFQRTLLPMADLVVDIHAGGKTLDFVPFVCAHVLADKEQQARCVAAMQAFNAPYHLMIKELDAVGMYDTAAEALGKTFVTTELGGGGSASATTAAIAKRGVANLLMHAGILAGTPELNPSRRLEMTDPRGFITSAHRGLLELCVDLGAAVRTGEVIAQVYDTDRSGPEPQVYRAAIDGVLAGRHFPGLIRPGDTLAVVAVPAD